MLVHVSPWVVFLVFSLVQGLTTGIYLLTRRPRWAPPTWVGLLVLGLTLQVLDYGLAGSGVYFRHKHLYFTPLFFSWCYGPLLWGAVRAVYGARRPLAWQHFLPGAAQLLFYVAVSVQDFDTKAWIWLHVHKPYTRYLEYYGTVASVAAYLTQALLLVRAQQHRPRWLWRTLLGIGAFYTVAAIDPLVNAAYLPAGAPKFYLTSLLLPMLTYGAALLGLLRNVAAPLAPLATTTPATASEPAPAPAVVPASKAAAPPDPALLAQGLRAMETELLYRNPDLSLGLFAQHLGLTTNATSHLINAGTGQSFTDWINGYRLAEVERRLLTADARRYTVLALALDAGFNSKATFNRAFKERNNLTPSQYQKKYQITFQDDQPSVAG